MGRSDLSQYFTTLQNTLVPIYLLQYATQAISDSKSYTGSQQISILDSAARAIIDAANDAKAAAQICIPKNSTYTLRENFAPCLSIICILPENAYNNVTSPLTFDTTVYSYFSLTTNLTVTKKAALPVITHNVNWNCSQNDNPTC